MKKKSAVGSFLFGYRWYLGVAVLILAVIFEVHGSSIGAWKTYMPDQAGRDDGLLWGQDRPIRSDEWNLFTPLALSQYYNQFGVTSDIPRATETDLYIVYGQPVRDWSIIFRPFQIGYLFLNPARGLSFYWIGKLIALLLVSFEFGMLITKRKKWLSFAYAFAVTFAPVTQWWFSINAFPDMLVYGQGIILCIYHYMQTPLYGKRIAYALGLFLLCGAYILVLYPAWQIPFFYVFAAVGIWCIAVHWKKSIFQWKKDLPILLLALLLLGLSMYLILSRSWETIQTVMHSAYPGERKETGGLGLYTLFQYIGTLFFPFREHHLPINVCGLALFFDLFPCGIILAAVNFFRKKKKDVLALILLLPLALLGIFTVFGFPAALAEISLLSQSPPTRTIVAVSYVNLLLLFRAVAGFKKSERLLWKAAAAGFSLFAAITMVALSSTLLYKSYYTYGMLFGSMAILFVLLTAALLNKKAFSAVVIALALIAGGTVNPARTGLGVIENHTLGKAITSVVSRDDGAWLVVDPEWFPDDFPLMYGAKTVNCVNTYMNKSLWERLDPEGVYSPIYNRYAHMAVCLTNTEATHVELLYADSILLTLNTKDISKTKAEYILANTDLSVYNDENIQFEMIFSDPAVTHSIYQVKLTNEP